MSNLHTLFAPEFPNLYLWVAVVIQRLAPMTRCSAPTNLAGNA